MSEIPMIDARIKKPLRWQKNVPQPRVQEQTPNMGTVWWGAGMCKSRTDIALLDDDVVAALGHIGGTLSWVASAPVTERRGVT